MKQSQSVKTLVKLALCVILVLTSVSMTGCKKEDFGQMKKKDFLKASGKEIKTNYGEGSPIVLKGTNVGGYLLQEFWMTPLTYEGDVTDQTDVLRVLNEKFGAETAAELIKVYEDNYFTEEDFANCAEMGMNVLRLPFWWRNFVDEDGVFYGYDANAADPYAKAFERIDWFVETAGKHGLYVILDMHGAPGSQNGSDHSGLDGHDNKAEASEFFFGDNAAKNQELYYDLWKIIAARYAGNPIVAGYDLLNEPYCTYRYNHPFGMTDSELRIMLWDIYNHAYEVIREADPDHMLIMEATWDPDDLPSPDRYGWENVMYEYHNYLYDDYDNAKGQQISNMKKKVNSINRRNFDVPSYLGEFSYFNNIDAWDEGLTLLDDAGISYTTWTYKTTSSNGNWGIYHHQASLGNNFILSKNNEDKVRSRFEGVLTSKGKVNQKLRDVLEKHFKGEQ